MPVYDVAAAAEALDLAPKQLDNLLNRNDIDGVTRTHRGVDRLLTASAVEAIRLAIDLGQELGLSLSTALRVAMRVRTGAGELRGEFTVLRVDVRALAVSVAKRLDLAVETVGKRKRGRPTRRAGGAFAERK